MKLALFDLDHTVLDGDTNILWIDYLIAHRLASPETASRQQHFMALYAREALDMTQYMDFHLAVLAQRRVSAWMPVIQNFVQSQLMPRLAPEALSTLQSHRCAGDRVALVTATNSLLVDVLGQALGITTIATQVEIVDDCLTGQTVGLPSFRAHKIARVEQWLGKSIHSTAIESSHFYSDSSNDLPLLQAVSHPVAVNADPKLRAFALRNGWAQCSWKARSGAMGSTAFSSCGVGLLT